MAAKAGPQVAHLLPARAREQAEPHEEHAVVQLSLAATRDAGPVLEPVPARRRRDARSAARNSARKVDDHRDARVSAGKASRHEK